MPAVNEVRLAPETAPNKPDHVPVVIVPTAVKLDAVTPEPKVVPLNTEVPLIKYVLPVARFKFSEDVQAEVALTQLNVLSIVPLSVKPPPSAVASVGLAVAPKVMLISATWTIVELIVSVVPLTVKLPEITTLLLIVVVPVVAPILNTVAAFAKLTVNALVLIKSKLVDPVINDVLIVGLVPNTNEPVPVSSLITLNN